ncbi:MAG: hypothetical protein GF350_05205 [Chitinivibrionales bacterium]|nr:hypothetical protein [Chitinivibrionales bacterium]
MALLQIKCPECKSLLWIDPASGKVVDHKSEGHKKADFNEFLKTSRKGKDWEDKLKKARDEESRRKAEWEEKFKKARESPDELDGDYESPFKWE